MVYVSGSIYFGIDFEIFFAWYVIYEAILIKNSYLKSDT
jgi:hypothetical protein